MTFSVEFEWRGIKLTAGGEWDESTAGSRHEAPMGREVEVTTISLGQVDLWPMVEALAPNAQDEIYDLIDEAIGQEDDNDD